MLLPAAPARALEMPKCPISEASFCLEQGRARCPSKTNARNPAQACQRWTQACLVCHQRMTSCVGYPYPIARSRTCITCTGERFGCLKEIDKRYWPNRRKR